LIEALKKYGIICLSIVVFLPAIVQLLHTFEDHEHATTCVSKSDHHFHQNDLDCQLFHTQHQYYSYDFSNNYEVIPNNYYISEIFVKPLIIETVYKTHKSSRAPPIFTV
jgi:hypothetical protein